MKNFIILSFLFFLLNMACGNTGHIQGQYNLSQDDEIDSNSQNIFSLSWKWQNNKDLNWIELQGTVINNSSIIYDTIEMNLILRDANSNLLGVTTVYLSPTIIKPGEESIFRTYILNTICPTDTLKLEYYIKLRE